MPHATVKAHSAKFLKNRLGSFIAKSTLSVALASTPIRRAFFLCQHLWTAMVGLASEKANSYQLFLVFLLTSFQPSSGISGGFFIGRDRGLTRRGETGHRS